jgi:very-short-patch-repair endonuclease
MKATANSMRSAKLLRRSLSKPEALLWRLLRGSPNGVRFRRQYPVGPYIADFYCPIAKLVIEIDGQVHEHGNAATRDEARDAYLKALGLKVMRIAARDVLASPDTVADGLIQLCAKGPSTTQLR